MNATPNQNYTCIVSYKSSLTLLLLWFALSKTAMLRTYSSNPIGIPKIHISKHFIGF